MSKYLKLFETTSQYEAYMGGGILPNVSLIEETNKVEYNPYIPPIIYTASEKLVETTDAWIGGIHIGAFNTAIKSHTFNEETGVGVIEFEEELTLIGDTASYYEGGAAFYGCTNMTSITIPNTVTTLYGYAFADCKGLTSITIPDSVTSISYSAFSGCCFTATNFINNSSLDAVSNNYWRATIIDSDVDGLCIKDNSVVMYRDTSDIVSIPDSVTSIGDFAFQNCSNLTSITIPNSVTSIGNQAFECCSRSLTSVTIGNGVTSIGDSAFIDCYFTATNFINNSSLDAVSNNYWRATIIDSEIDGLCIKDNIVIRYRDTSNIVTIPNSVTSIGGSAFSGCTNLTSITIPNSVTSIGDSAFYYCTNLTSITIPNSVTSIDGSAFKYCSNLTSVTVERTAPPTLHVDIYGQYSTFDNNANGRKIYVPAESVDAYKAASGWSDYANDIEAIPTA